MKKFAITYVAEKWYGGALIISIKSFSVLFFST